MHLLNFGGVQHGAPFDKTNIFLYRLFSYDSRTLSVYISIKFSLIILRSMLIR